MLAGALPSFFLRLQVIDFPFFNVVFEALVVHIGRYFNKQIQPGMGWWMVRFLLFVSVYFSTKLTLVRSSGPAVVGALPIFFLRIRLILTLTGA